jgi:hypothetical protein
MCALPFRCVKIAMAMPPKSESLPLVRAGYSRRCEAFRCEVARLQSIGSINAQNTVACPLRDDDS